MSNIIESMRNSGIKLLETESQDLAKWSKLKHKKEDLELFLNYNIAEIRFRTKKNEDRQIICTSNLALVNIFNTEKAEDKQKLAADITKGIRTRDIGFIDTYDLVESKRKTMSLNSWVIVNFISITPENILVLDELLRKLLKAK